MKAQNYKNHVQWYAPHHFIFYPVLFIAIVICSWCCFHYSEFRLLWLAVTALFMLLGLLSLMMRQHYALGNQNRIIRLELRLRYFILTQQRFEKLEMKLCFEQLAALRFASDEEFVELTDRAVKENLSGDAIKRSIKNWLPDHMRL
jgi:hypothetical protein